MWEALARSYNKEPYHLRRLLTEGAVRAADKRAQFIGIEAYEAAGGVVMRDLFQHDDGGWLQDPALLDRLVAEKLAAEAAALQAEGWRWIEGAVDFPHGHASRLRRLAGEPAALSPDEQASFEALKAEYDQLEETHARAEELPDEVDQRLGEIETALEAFDDRRLIYDPAEIARAGAFVSLDGSGKLRIERGYVRPQDEAPVVPIAPAADGETPSASAPAGAVQRAIITIGAGTPVLAGLPAPAVETPDEDDGIRPLPDRLVTELTAHRTLALRDALANDPDTVFIAVLHALCLKTFYSFASDSCLEIAARSQNFGTQAPGLNDTAAAKSIDARHRSWVGQLPREAGALWDALLAFDWRSRATLFAHCASLTVNAVHEPGTGRARVMAHADRLARAVHLDMAAAGWAPTADNYLGRVTKARILEAVTEAKGEASAQLIDHLKKPDMAKEAERLLDGTGWLPEPLRTPDVEMRVPDAPVDAAAESLPAFLAEADDGESAPPERHAAAAE